MPLLSYLHLSRHKKYQERKKKYIPSNAAVASKEKNRDAIEMDTLANTAALQQDTAGLAETTGASITTEELATALSPPKAATEKTKCAMVDPFNFSEDQIG